MSSARLASVLALALGVVSSAQEPAGTSPWFADYDLAMKAAKEQKKDLLVDFTGSDWCPPCQKLHAEVFAKDEFAKATTGKYVLLALDYPRGAEAKAKVPNAARNQELLEGFGIEYFPTVLVLDVEETVLAKTGFRPDGPAEYAAHVEEIVAKGRAVIAEVQALVAEGEKVPAEGRAAFLGKALDLLAGMDAGSPKIAVVAGFAREAATLDPQNEKGMLVRALGLLIEKAVANADDLALARKFDPKNAAALFEKAVHLQMKRLRSKEDVEVIVVVVDELFATGALKDADLDKDLSINAAFWNSKVLDRPEQAKASARRAKALFGDTLPEEVAGLLNPLLQDDDSGKKEGEAEKKD